MQFLLREAVLVRDGVVDRYGDRIVAGQDEGALHELGPAAECGVRLPYASVGVREFSQDDGVVPGEFRAIHLDLYSGGGSLECGEFWWHQIGRPVNQRLFPAGAPLLEGDFGEEGVCLRTGGCGDRQKRDERPRLPEN